MYAYDIKDVKFPPHNNKLSSMHSLKELYETWIMILDSLIVPPIDSELDKKIRKIIDRQEKCDHNSTFLDIHMIKAGKKTKRFLSRRLTREI